MAAVAGRFDLILDTVPTVHALNAYVPTLPGDRRPEGYVFPGMRGPLSDMSLTAVLRRMSVCATAHGFRGTFRDWVSEYTEHSGEVAEMALSHAIGDKAGRQQWRIGLLRPYIQTDIVDEGDPLSGRLLEASA